MHLYRESHTAPHKHQQFLETLFDVKRAKEKKIAAGVAPVPIPEAHTRVLSLLHEQVRRHVAVLGLFVWVWLGVRVYTYL